MFLLLCLLLCRADQLRRKDEEIISLLQEKVQLFRGMWEGLSPAGEEVSRPSESFFRSACSQELPRGASIMKDALQEGKRRQQRGRSAQSGVLVSNQKLIFNSELLLPSLYTV